MEDEEELALLGPTAVAWAVSDYLVDNYLKVTDLLEDDVDDLENEVFTPRRTINIDKIYTYKREILEMRHAIDPLAPALRNGLNNNKDVLRKALRNRRAVIDVRSRLAQQPRRDMAITAIVARPAQHQYLVAARQPPHRIGNLPPGLGHQRRDARAACDRALFRRAHLCCGQHRRALDRDHGAVFVPAAFTVAGRR